MMGYGMDEEDYDYGGVVRREPSVSLDHYDRNKTKKVGQPCICPGCGRAFIKKSYQQVFHSNKGPGNCKDRYWNEVNPRGRGFYY